MPLNPVGPSTLGTPGISARTATPTASRPARVRRRVWVGCGLLLTGVLGVLSWSLLDRPALADAEASYRRNDLATALRLARGHLAYWPFSRPARLIAARCLSRLDKPEEAEAFYKKAGALDLDDQHVRALGLVKGNRREDAILAYGQILDRRPDDVLALRRLAAVQISQRLWTDALSSAQRLTEIPGAAVIGHTLAGVVSHDMNEPERAVVDFGRVLALDPELKQMPLKPRSMFWAEYGHDLLVTGHVAEAQQYLHRGLREGNDAQTADLLGQCYYQQGGFDDAERWWRLATEWDPGRADTWWRIGRLALQRGRPREAVEPLRLASRLAPETIGPAYGLSLAYRRLGLREESDRLLERVAQIRAKSARPRGVTGNTPGRAS